MVLAAHIAAHGTPLANAAIELEHRVFGVAYGPQDHEADYTRWLRSTLLISCEQGGDIVGAARIIIDACGDTPTRRDAAKFGGQIPPLAPCADWTTIAIAPGFRGGLALPLMARTFLRAIRAVNINHVTAVFDVRTLDRFNATFGHPFIVPDGAAPAPYAGSAASLPVWTTLEVASRSFTSTGIYQLLYGQPIDGTVDVDWCDAAALCDAALNARGPLDVAAHNEPTEWRCDENQRT